MKKLTSIIATLLIAISAVTALATQTLANEPMNPFTDVDAENIYNDSIKYLAANDIVGGYADGTFKPAKNLNRAEMLKILVEGQITLGTTIKEDVELYGESKCFNDVKTGEWYAKYVCHAKAAGWVQGYDNGKLFKPEQEVTFVEALKMTMKAFEINYDAATDPWYKNAVESASDSNYIPVDIDSFDKKLRRDQMADLLTRILKDKNGELEKHLGIRSKMIVTYETIEQGANLWQEFLDGNLGVEITATGFSPKTLTISQGDTVKFINKDSKQHWPASAVHPTHTAYPGSGIDKCGTLDEYYIFDSCHSLAQGEEYSFPFDEIGTWTYHDHLNPKLKGTIIVE